MSKELTPLEALESIKRNIDIELVNGTTLFYEDFDIIEKELKDYEELKTQHIMLVGGRRTDKQFTIRSLKEHKALEIINSKNVQVSYLKECETLDDYNSIWGGKGFENRKLVQEEYDLLKEVLL